MPVRGEYKRNTDYEDTSISAAAYTDTEYLPEGIQPTIPDDSELEIPEGKTKEEVIGEINEQAEREAVLSKGGFYISRYEAGKEGTDTLVSKAGATVWNSIPQADCKTEAKKFINNDNVKSALCSGIQWDMTMEFVNGKKDGAGNTIDVTVNGDRGGSSKATSGQHPADRMCNIFDLEENCREYVAEKHSYNDSYPFVYRGGDYLDGYSASYRNNFGDGSANSYRSFRFALYVM